MAETAARLCKADLVTATVGEFPEVQGIAGGHLATAEGLAPEIAAAIRDHYKPVGPSDAVPTAPVTVAVALADKLDTLGTFFAIDERPTGSRDPFALRRTALAIISIIFENGLRISVANTFVTARNFYRESFKARLGRKLDDLDQKILGIESMLRDIAPVSFSYPEPLGSPRSKIDQEDIVNIELRAADAAKVYIESLLAFLADRLKVQQREAGIRPDVIDAVFSLGGEDDLVRLVARAKALQAVLQTPDGASLLAGYRRGANIVRIEEGKEPGVSEGEVDQALLSEPAEVALNAALDAAVPEAASAVAAEDFTQAMTALARLRPAVDAFFEHVTVNAHEAAVRRNRLALLARLRTAVHAVADFSKLEG
jgi:glycyl-tRNA synthetase beta chain